MEKLDKKLAKVKTLCCKAKWYRKGRADYRCTKCDKDVTMHLVYLREILEDDYTK